MTSAQVRVLFEAEGLSPALVQTVPTDEGGPDDAAVVGFDEIAPSSVEAALRAGFQAFALPGEPPLARVTLLLPGAGGKPREVVLRPENLLFTEGAHEAARAFARGLLDEGVTGPVPQPSSVPAPRPEPSPTKTPDADGSDMGALLFRQEDPLEPAYAPATAGSEAEEGTPEPEPAQEEEPSAGAAPSGAHPTMAYRPNVLEPEPLRALLEAEFLDADAGERATLRGDTVLVRAPAARFPQIRRYLNTKEREARWERRERQLPPESLG